MIYTLESSASTNHTKLHVNVHAEGTFSARHPCDIKGNLQINGSCSHTNFTAGSYHAIFLLLEP
jgi:hypothetical protein